MSPIRAAWHDYREAVRGFSRPARLLLLTNLLAWTCHGIFAVLFNLYLVEAGASEGFVGRAVAPRALGVPYARGG